MVAVPLAKRNISLKLNTAGIVVVVIVSIVAFNLVLLIIWVVLRRRRAYNSPTPVHRKLITGERSGKRPNLDSPRVSVTEKLGALASSKPTVAIPVRAHRRHSSRLRGLVAQDTLSPLVSLHPRRGSQRSREPSTRTPVDQTPPFVLAPPPHAHPRPRERRISLFSMAETSSLYSSMSAPREMHDDLITSPIWAMYTMPATAPPLPDSRKYTWRPRSTTPQLTFRSPDSRGGENGHMTPPTSAGARMTPKAV